MGLLPKLELLAVFCSSDNVVGRSHTAVNRNIGVWTGQYIVLQSFVPLLQTWTNYVHGCTCRLLVAYTVMHACKYWNVNGMCTLRFDCMLQHLTHQHLERASVSDSVTISVMQQASNTCKCSYLNILQASLLHPCLHAKAKHALMKLQA